MMKKTWLFIQTSGIMPAFKNAGLAKTLIAGLVLSLVINSVTTLAAFARPVPPPNPDELKVALNAEYETLNPILNTMVASLYVQDATVRPLMALDARGKPEVILLKQFPIIANDKSHFIEGKSAGLEVQIEILPAATWGDGTPVTCADVRLAWQIGKSPMVATPNREDYDNIQSIDASSNSAKICHVVFKKARFDYYTTLPRPVPAHLEGPILTKFGGEAQGYERNSLYQRDPTNPGLYNGPYRVSKVVPGASVELVLNEHFYGKKPAFKKLIFKFLFNSAAIEAQLMTGEIDIASSSGLSFDQAMKFEKRVAREKLPMVVDIKASGNYAHLDLNLDSPILKDLRVRQALFYGFNRNEMSQAFFEGRQPAASHFASPLDDYFIDEKKDPAAFKTYPYDKAKAAVLLDQAGWVKDGVYRKKDGKTLTLTLSSSSDTKLNEMLEVFLQNAWKQIGVEVKIKNYPARVLFSEVLKKRQFDISLTSSVTLPSSVLRNSYHSVAIPGPENSWAGGNRAGWRNPKVDVWLDQAETEFDSSVRKKLMRQVLRAYSEDIPTIPAFYKAVASVIPAALQGYDMSPHTNTEFLHVENWHY